MASIGLAAAAVLQVALPPTPDLAQPSLLAPRRVPAVIEPRARNYPAMLAAAIFAPDRPRVPGVLDFAGSLAGYRVLGIAIAGNTVSAVVAGPSGTISRAAVGRRLDDWTLIGADATRLVFTRGKEQGVLLVNSREGTQ